MSEIVPNNSLRSIMQSLEDLLEASEGELTTEIETLMKTLTLKIDNCVEFDKYVDLRIEFLDKKKKELQRAVDQLEMVKDRFNDYMLFCAQQTDEKELLGDVYSVKVVKNPPKVEITDAALLPGEYIKTEIVNSVDKALLKQDLKSKDIFGAKLVQTEKIKISVKKV